MIMWSEVTGNCEAYNNGEKSMMNFWILFLKYLHSCSFFYINGSAIRKNVTLRGDKGYSS